MNDSQWRYDVSRRVRFFGKVALCTLIDMVFVAIWAVAQWLVGSLVRRLGQYALIDTMGLAAFQAVFFASTLAVVVAYIYVDVRVSVTRLLRWFADEEGKPREGQPAAGGDNENDAES